MYRAPSLATPAWVWAPGKSGPRVQTPVAASNASVVLSTRNPSTYPPITYSFVPTWATAPSTRVLGTAAVPGTQLTRGRTVGPDDPVTVNATVSGRPGVPAASGWLNGVTVSVCGPSPGFQPSG